MAFEVGETVVYPHHGAARIEEIKMRSIKGENRMYLKLRVSQGDLTIEVPAENVDLVGVRDVVGREGLYHVFDVLKDPFTEEPINWSRRYKANLEKLASGDVIKVAEVVRDLWRRDHYRGLSAGEKRMFVKAKQILVSELALAERILEKEAVSFLDKILQVSLTLDILSGSGFMVEEETVLEVRDKVFVEKLASGDLIQVAEVMRDLLHLQKNVSLSEFEQNCLFQSEKILLFELSRLENISETKVRDNLDRIFAYSK